MINGFFWYFSSSIQVAYQHAFVLTVNDRHCKTSHSAFSPQPVQLNLQTTQAQILETHANPKPTLTGNLTSVDYVKWFWVAFESWVSDFS